MITAGIDVGFENARIVILKDGKIAGRGQGESGGAGRAAVVEQVWKETLNDAKIVASDVEKVAVTGKGKFNVEFADDRVSKSVAAAKAAKFLCPGVTSAMDVGADETMVVVLGKEDRIQEFVINEKCVAGLGRFLKQMSRRLELTLEEMSALNRPGSEDVTIKNDGCMVFAEMEALNLLNNNVPPREIAAAITETAALRASSVLNDITLPNRDCVVLLGGLTQNAAFTNALKSHAGLDFVIPGDAEYAGALGAALFAAD